MLKSMIILLGWVMALTPTYAQIVNEEIIKDTSGVEIIEREVYLADPETGEKKLFNQRFIRNKDGTLQPLRGDTSEAEKKRHDVMCEQLGGKNVSSETSVILGPETVDAVVCEMSQALETHAANAGAFQANTGGGFITGVSAPSGSFPVGSIYTVQGSWSYFYNNSPSYNESLVIDLCSMTGSGTLGAPGASGYGSRTLFLTCQASAPGIYTSIATACIAGNCQAAQGAITQQ